MGQSYTISKPPRTALFILQGSVFFLLLGRSYQCFFWDFPLRAFFWDEALMGSLVEGLTGDSWAEVMAKGQYDLLISGLQIAVGGFFLVAACCVLVWERIPPRLRLMLPASSRLLLILAILIWKEKSYQIPQFFELSIQIIAPWLLWKLTQPTPKLKQLFALALIATLITFLAHGLYALNLYPTPGKFVDMSIRILGFSEEQSYTFLWVMGMLDILLIPASFIPFLRNLGLYYAVIWGLLTALARVVAYWTWGDVGAVLHENGYQTAFRLVHGVLPLFLLLWSQAPQQKKGQKPLV